MRTSADVLPTLLAGLLYAAPAVSFDEPLPKNALVRLGGGPGGHSGPIHVLDYSPDGRHVATADHGPSPTVRIWDVKSGKIIFQDAERPGRACAVCFSPKGDILAAGYGQKVILWEPSTGKATRTLPGHVTPHLDLRFSLDGTRLASAGQDGNIRIWDLGSGKEALNFQVEAGNASAITFSTDLRVAASTVAANDVIHLWDLSTGKQRGRLKRAAAEGVALAFTPDGRRLLELRDGRRFVDWELCSGQMRQPLVVLPTHTGPAKCVRISPDGRYLAFGGSESFGEDPRTPVVLWFLPRPGLAFPLGHLGVVNALSFSPDSKTLASASEDHTAIVWDVPAIMSWTTGRDRAVAEPLGDWWDALAGSATAARQPIWELVRSDNAVAFLRQHLPPAVALPAAKELDDSIAKLDSADFAIRSAALKHLTQCDPQLQDLISAKLLGNPSPEARRALQELAAHLEGRHLQQIRAVEVLELINTQPARDLLVSLATGDAASRLTREAAESLDRLRHRPKRGD